MGVARCDVALPSTEELSRCVHAFRRAHALPGLAVVVHHHDRLLVATNIGFRDLENRLPVDARTMFCIGSITKQFVAAATLSLVEHGALTLDSSVAGLLPELAGAVPAEVRVRDLLSHRSGIAYDIGVDNGAIACAHLHDHVRSRLAASMNVDSRGAWFYCNTNYVILGWIIERVGGLPLDRYLASQIIPGEIAEEFCFHDPAGHRRAFGYAARGTVHGSVDAPDPVQAFASGTLRATASGLARWTRLLWAGRIVQPASVAEMISVSSCTAASPHAYGLGVYIADRDGLTELSHDGNTAGFTSQIAYYPQVDVTIAVLANSSKHVAELLANQLQAITFGMEQPANVGLGAPRVPTSDYVGEYRLGDQRIAVRCEGEYLCLRTPGGRDVRLYRFTESGFRETDGIEFEYEFTATPRGMSLIISRNGKMVAQIHRLSTPPADGLKLM